MFRFILNFFSEYGINIYMYVYTDKPCPEFQNTMFQKLPTGLAKGQLEGPAKCY